MASFIFVLFPSDISALNVVYAKERSEPQREPLRFHSSLHIQCVVYHQLIVSRCLNLYRCALPATQRKGLCEAVKIVLFQTNTITTCLKVGLFFISWQGERLIRADCRGYTSEFSVVVLHQTSVDIFLDGKRAVFAKKRKKKKKKRFAIFISDLFVNQTNAQLFFIIYLVLSYFPKTEQIRSVERFLERPACPHRYLLFLL